MNVAELEVREIKIGIKSENISFGHYGSKFTKARCLYSQHGRIVCQYFIHILQYMLVILTCFPA